MTFSISENHLLKILQEVNDEALIDWLKSTEMLVTEDPQWEVLRGSIFDGIKNFVKKSNAQTTNNYMNSFTRKLIRLMQDSKVSKNKVSSKKRLAMLLDAESIMLNKLTEHISISDIASQLNISERTLLYTFKKRFNMGPKAYMKILKLNHVYQLLNKGNNINIMASVARESGFWHMGQFHKDYKNFFGELPSETYKKAND